MHLKELGRVDILLVEHPQAIHTVSSFSAKFQLQTADLDNDLVTNWLKRSSRFRLVRGAEAFRDPLGFEDSDEFRGNPDFNVIESANASQPCLWHWMLPCCCNA